MTRELTIKINGCLECPHHYVNPNDIYFDEWSSQCNLTGDKEFFNEDDSDSGFLHICPLPLVKEVESNDCDCDHDQCVMHCNIGKVCKRTFEINGFY